MVRLKTNLVNKPITAEDFEKKLLIKTKQKNFISDFFAGGDESYTFSEIGLSPEEIALRKEERNKDMKEAEILRRKRMS